MKTEDKIDLAEALMLVRKLAERGANMRVGESAVTVAGVDGRLTALLRRVGEDPGSHWLGASDLTSDLLKRRAAGDACHRRLVTNSDKDPGVVLLLQHVQSQIDALETHPGSWGDAATLDFTMLMLVRYRLLLTRPKAALAAERQHDDSAANREVPRLLDEQHTPYCAFVAAVNGEDTNWFLHSVLGEAGKLDELPRLLGDFARWVDREWPPEDGPRLPPPCSCGRPRTQIKTNHIGFIVGGCDAGHWWNLATGGPVVLARPKRH